LFEVLEVLCFALQAQLTHDLDLFLFLWGLAAHLVAMDEGWIYFLNIDL
jgi:hypothetical protein